MRSIIRVPKTLLLAASIVAATSCTCPDIAFGEIESCLIEANRMVVSLRAGAYSTAQGILGQRVEMEGFGRLMVPGQPLLPMKVFLIALPPGALARSVEVLSTETTELPGTYQIEPCPEIAILDNGPHSDDALRMRREWEANHDAVYLSDTPFPSAVSWLSGRGTLRKYSYAAVAFCPFTYSPKSGRLVYHSAVDLAINFDRLSEGGGDPPLSDRLADRSADEKAATLFSDYDQVADLYLPEGAPSAPMSETYNYVIITTADLVGAITASQFPTWKGAVGYRLRTVLTTDGEIAGQPGRDLAERIRNFLRAYYTTWGIEYVLLVGDYAAVPMRICYPNAAYHVYDPGDPGLIAPGTPTDYYYADLSLPDAVSWDFDGDGYPGEYSEDMPDFLAEVAVGRIPVNDAARITYTLNKLVAFEQETGAWKRNVLHAGAILFFANQDRSGYPFVDGATCLDSIETGLMEGMNITHFCERTGLVTSSFPWPALSQPAFTRAWGRGQYGIVNWSGHGWPDGAYRTVWTWDDGDGVPESGNGELESYRFVGHGAANLDDDYPSIVFAISCDVGYPEPNPFGNLGIDMLTLPGWGPSAGVVSSSRPAAVSKSWKVTRGGTEEICFQFNRYMVDLGERVGDALYDGKFYATANYGWSMYYEYMDLYNYNLYGDPALNVNGTTASIATLDDRDMHAGLGFESAQPNPFASVTTLRLAVPAGARARIAVHDVGGRRVATLADRTTASQHLLVTWDGTDDSGQMLAPGIYFITALVGGEQAVQKVVLLR